MDRWGRPSRLHSNKRRPWLVAVAVLAAILISSSALAAVGVFAVVVPSTQRAGAASGHGRAGKNAGTANGATHQYGHGHPTSGCH
jgi:hypothetical protein